MTDSIAVMAPGQRVLDANGSPVSGAKLKFFDAGTSNPKTVHSDSGLATTLGTTVHCDTGGYPVSSQGSSTKTQVYVGDSAYKLIITDADDVTVATHDNIKGAVDTASFAPEFSKAKEPVVSLTSSRAAATTDYGKLIQANSTAGSITYSLPAAATAGDGTRIRVRHVGTAGTVSIVASGSESIDGPQGANNAYQLTTYGNEVLLICTGAGWVASALFIPDNSISSAQLSSAISGTFVKTGSILIWPKAGALPTGYLDCDGSAKSRTTHSELFAEIGETYGNGDGSTTFNVPDFRGQLIRGVDGGAGVDPDAATRTDRGDGTTGDNVGTKQADAFAQHNHGGATGSNGADTVGLQTEVHLEGTGIGVNFTVPGGSTPSGDAHTHTISNDGGNETRPTNVAVRFIIFSGASAATGASATLHTLLHGSGAPTPSIGNDDDFYIDIATYTIYGPKASGSWTGTDYRLAIVSQGAWATSTSYVVNDVVTNNGSSYLCKLAHTSGTDSDEPGVGANTGTYWQVLAAKGADGQSLNWQGTWATSTSYAVNDAVENDGQSYIATAAHTSGASTEPGVGASWTSNWDLIAQAGSDGSDGADGVTLNWQGAWATSTAYALNDAVENDGSSYIATSAHTSAAATEPGTGASWATVWDLIAQKGADGAGSVSSVFGRSGAVVAANSDYDITQVDFSASDRIAGRATSGAGLAEELTAAQVRTIINVEDGATADQTAADIRALGFFDTSNDGAASGLDADLLDGNHASAFATSGHNHSGVYEPVDAEIVRADTDDNFTAGYTATADNDGTQSSGTYTPDPAGGNLKRIVNGGAFTLAAPSATGDYTIIIQITNNGSAGSVTTSGFESETGDSLTTTDGDDFFAYITKLNGFQSLHIVALQ